MAHYYLRLFDQSETITDILEAEYVNALDALDAAKALSSGGTVEVWSHYGRVARVKKDNQPSGPNDKISG